MKKITALALIAIALVACKKETKTVTRVDPKTGKTETVTVEVSEEEASKPKAIADSSGVFKQKFILDKGVTYPLVSYQREIQSLNTPDGKTMSATTETTDEMSVTVNDFKDNIYDLTLNMVGKRMSNTSNGKTVSIDTKQAAPKEEALKMDYLVSKGLAGNKLNVKMDAYGNIKSVTGFDVVYNNLKKAIAGTVKDTKQQNAFIESFKTGFNEAMMKEQLGKNLKLLPAKGAKIGDKWTDSEDIVPGKVKQTLTFTLTKVEDGKAEISVTGVIPSKSDKQTQNGMTHTMSVGGTESGKIIIDENTGWLLNQNLSIKTNQKESVSDGKQTQSMSKNSTTSIIINPSYK
ncbi:DUF6263 family protein [Epilithonimonas lactis]|uniref:Lipoprotein n=1 Tax=Epilithonimonas lactis TaxID=421072 RepID=A0A085BG56_9FLAO|nr:DUF6263 family protein [Epilithonimonas lactis]KFC21451.1 hypothetical protein IO89_14840 [Epilithonimonas lactis]SEP85732.1 hypothetical protein SAMN04488097_0876 [Epilithonimonas lactis]